MFGVIFFWMGRLFRRVTHGMFPDLHTALSVLSVCIGLSLWGRVEKCCCVAQTLLHFLLIYCPPRGNVSLTVGAFAISPYMGIVQAFPRFFFFFFSPSWLPFFQKCFQPFPLYVLMLELPFSASALKWHRGRCRFFSQKSFCAWCVLRQQNCCFPQ